MQTTGNQLRAARALIAMDQAALAESAGVPADAIEAMEKRGAAAIPDDRAASKAVVAALEGAGIEFLYQGRPGVRLKSSSVVDRPDPPNARSNDEWPEADA
jgi:hypothetical protein